MVYFAPQAIFFRDWKSFISRRRRFLGVEVVYFAPQAKIFEIVSAEKRIYLGVINSKNVEVNTSES